MVETLEIGGDRVTVFRQDAATGHATRTATLVLRGATQNALDDVERAVDDAVNVVKAITRDPRLVAGAGAAEVQLVDRTSPTPRTRPRASPSTPCASTPRPLRSCRACSPRPPASTPPRSSPGCTRPTATPRDGEGVCATGVDLNNQDGSGTLDALDEGVLDLLVTKTWAVKLATEAARTVLAVDQIIVARQAGGPKPPGPNKNWDED